MKTIFSNYLKCSGKYHSKKNHSFLKCIVTKLMIDINDLNERFINFSSILSLYEAKTYQSSLFYFYSQLLFSFILYIFTVLLQTKLLPEFGIMNPVIRWFNIHQRNFISSYRMSEYQSKHNRKYYPKDTC
jgi:hypothetical protein